MTVPESESRPAALPSTGTSSGRRRRSGPDSHRDRGKSTRRRSREIVLQGLYEWLISGSDLTLIDAHMREQDDFSRCDLAHYGVLLRGCIEGASQLDVVLAQHADRKTTELSPVEHAVLLIGAYELKYCIDIPYRVVINESVELAKSFGGTDGHRYVNGVMDKIAMDLRPDEATNAQHKRA